MTIKTIPGKVVGVYSLRHVSGAEYIGGSGRCIANRIAVHRCSLRQGRHGSPRLQELWDRSCESDWVVLVLESCSKEQVTELEDRYLKQSKHLLNNSPTASGKGSKRSSKTREKIREGRAKYLETPGAREGLSERAKLQHQQGNFGQATFTPETREKWLSGIRAASSRPSVSEARSRNAQKLLSEGKLGSESWKDGPAHVRKARERQAPAVSLPDQTAAETTEPGALTP